MNKNDFRVMVIDDEPSFLLLITTILRDSGYEVQGFSSPEEALMAMDLFRPALVVTDLKMPGMDGLSLMEKTREKHPLTEFIMITAFATVETAVSAMKKGAVDYITKPLRSPDQLRSLVKSIFDRQCLTMKPGGDSPEIPPLSIIFAGMEEVLREIKDVATTEATVMLYGETGTGKSLIARTIHLLSNRKGPFVDINCAAIPENLLESELFGYEKGAFTGAVSSRKGKFEAAGNGTIFLDEVSEMSLGLQAKLLKVLQEKRFERLGSVEPIKSKARVIAASNRDLQEMIQEKRFREDLYYRLNVFPITIPSLRERRWAIPEIARYLLRLLSARMGKMTKEPSDELLERLSAYAWPGNIRELENVLERTVIVSKGDELSLPNLPSREKDPDQGTDGDLKAMEKSAIESALMKTQGNRKRAAEILGISLRTLQYKLKEYEIKK
ncbi:MAG: sigma-54-dependent Fis family transcriptional regulator [Nitrospirales bacterium]|nr:sigma-54-dependent Fis family transcriptional regulator [Nitrospirales bacterium]